MTMEDRSALDHIIAAANAIDAELEKIERLREPSMRAADQFVADCLQKTYDRTEAPQEGAGEQGCPPVNGPNKGHRSVTDLASGRDQYREH